MKGAIGNALILNIVITFIIIFYMLLIGSMAYSKAYKTKNYLLNMVDTYESTGENKFTRPTTLEKWDTEVNEFLGKIGYPLNTSNIKTSTCPHKESSGYMAVINSNAGRYDYCVYKKNHPTGSYSLVNDRYNYLVLVYMEFDVPIVGEFIKITITGETKTYTKLN